MDDGLKKRLVGAVLLLSLGVIFLPVLFDRERMAPIDHTSQIPEPPATEPLTIELPQPVPEPQATEAFPIAEEPAPAPAVEVERLTPSGDVRTYALQVASFRGESMASELAAKLAADGHDVFTRASRYDSGTIHRVLIGPTLSRPSLDKVKSQVDKKYRVDSLIIRYSPP